VVLMHVRCRLWHGERETSVLHLDNGRQCSFPIDSTRIQTVASAQHARQRSLFMPATLMSLSVVAYSHQVMRK
jgi:hypothetical protein